VPNPFRHCVQQRRLEPVSRIDEANRQTFAAEGLGFEPTVINDRALQRQPEHPMLARPSAALEQ
jgi:hypothetical protein